MFSWMPILLIFAGLLGPLNQVTFSFASPPLPSPLAGSPQPIFLTPGVSHINAIMNTTANMAFKLFTGCFQHCCNRENHPFCHRTNGIH